MAPLSTRSTAFWPGLTLAAFALELLLFSYLRNVAGPYVSPVLFLGASLLFTWAAYRALRAQPYDLADRPGQSLLGRWQWALAGVLLLAAFYPRLRDIINQYPVAVETSDVIPSIEIYLRRLQNGETVYTLIKDFGYDLSPTYLPMMWLPFLIPDSLNMDYRWLGFWVFAVGVALYARRLAATRPDLFEGSFKLLVPILVVLPLLAGDTHILGLSIESLVIGYYFILVAGIFSKSPVLRAIGLVLCLLSRFSLVFWAPFYLLLIYRHEGRKAALWVAALVLVGILGLYVIPFLSADWSSFLKGQGYYTAAALGEWESNLNEQGLPNQLYRGLGLAALYYHYLPGELLDRLNVLRLSHLLASVGSVAVVVLVYWLRRHRLRLDYRYLALLALKLNLTLFYAFIQVPYDNLLLLVIFLSAWVILCLRRPAETPAAN
ncbi:hypothetical protein [Hymenobacter sp. CRA2]|uniref:hypothetical protein n=1 Tax=Hymenobacter sp. CRA2 TaxID=1955620 RepID=UPI00098F7DFB|nr:hypothetical protein [Hymenobacter sp. CRA2]OON70803.1 hypothetical protein B0919_01975 [Hymenobacter sp. CRA2]